MSIFNKSLKEALKENISDVGGFSKPIQELESPLLDLLPPIFDASFFDTENTMPALIQEISQTQEPIFVHQAIVLLSIAATEHGILTLKKYEACITSAKAIFGDDALHARFQAKLHAALLTDYSKEPKRIADAIQKFSLFLAQNTAENHIPDLMLSTLHTALKQLCTYNEKFLYSEPSRFFEAIDLVFMEYEVQKKKDKLYPYKEIQEEFDEEHGNIVYQALDSMRSSISWTKNTVKKFNVFKQKQETNLKPTFSPSLQIFNTKIKSHLKEVEKYAFALDNEELLEQLRTFRSLLIEQDFRIVVLGEGKRGKSSLINAILGAYVVPTRAILPETSTNIELYYSDEPTYTVEWLDKYQFDKLEEYLTLEGSNLLLQKKIQDVKKALEQEEFQKELADIKLKNKEDLPNYTSADGLYTSLVKKVQIGLPLSALPKGMTLIDTPALNATDQFRDFLALEECMTADCLIFVLDSRRPDSYSELSFIRQLAKRGRAISLIGVLTHPFDNSQELEIAKQRAFDHLHEGIRDVQGIELIDIVSFNPAQILKALEEHSGMLSKEAQKNIYSHEFLHFLTLLANIVNTGLPSQIYQERILSAYDQFLDFAQKSHTRALKEYYQTLPSAQHLELLQRHAEHLSHAAQSYSEHARSLILSVAHDIESWRVQRSRAVSVLEERLILHITNATHRYADSLGTNFAKESEWEEFDTKDAPRIAQTLLDEFLAEQRADIHIWEEKLQLFTNELREISILCLNDAQKSISELNSICTTHSHIDHILVQTGSHMQKLTLFLTGAGTGLLATSGMINLLAIGGATLAFLANPIIIPSALFIGATAYALRSFTNPIRRKEALLKRKEIKIREFASNLCEQLTKNIEDSQNELAAAYSHSINKSLAPALEIITSEAVNLQLYLLVTDKLKISADIAK